MKGQLRAAVPASWSSVALVLAAVVLALALSAPPAARLHAVGARRRDRRAPVTTWARRTDATCTACHPGFKSYPGRHLLVVPLPRPGHRRPCPRRAGLQPGVPPLERAQKRYTQSPTHARRQPAPRVASACLACHPTSVSIFDPGSSPHHSGQAHRVHRSARALPLRRLQQHAGKVACPPATRHRRAFHLVQADHPRLQELPVLPRHEARRQEGRRQQVRHLPQGHRHGAGRSAALHAGHQSEVRLLGVPLAEAARQRCQLRYQELPHVPQRQVPRRPADAGQQRRAPAATGAPPGTPTGYSCTLCHRSAVHTARPSIPRIRG